MMLGHAFDEQYGNVLRQGLEEPCGKHRAGQAGRVDDQVEFVLRFRASPSHDCFQIVSKRTSLHKLDRIRGILSDGCFVVQVMS